MNISLLFSRAALAGIVGLTAFWALHARQRRKLPTTAESINAIYPLMKKIEPFAVRGCFSDDEAFVQAFGRDGVHKCIHNAGCLVQLCQRAYLDHLISAEDIKDVMLRASHLRRMAMLLPLERIARYRLIFTMPHICARTIAYMYADLEANLEAIFWDSPDTLDRRREAS